MIPKIIHYCWFGDKDMPALERRCVESWRSKLPDWELVLWNEGNFDLDSVPYAREAYDKGKYAFVADVVRVAAIVEQGGIYLDTDIEVLSPLDSLLLDEAFVGYENRTNIGMGIMGAVPHFPLFEKMLDYYKTHHYIREDGLVDQTTIVQIMNGVLDSEGYVRSNEDTVFKGMHIYDRRKFYPKKLNDGTFDIRPESLTIHYGSASWLTEREKKRGNSLAWRNFARPFLRGCRSLLNRIFGEDRTRHIEISLREKIR